MDSLTQAVLGAAVAEVAVGRQLGGRAMLWGAALGTLPDLDVFVPMGDAVEAFTRHRSWSHSLLVLGVLSPLIGAALGRGRVGQEPGAGAVTRLRWTLTALAVFVTHVLLDACTVYGTQIFWPFVESSPQSWSTVFVIDPLYTLSLIVGLVLAQVWRRAAAGRARWTNVVALGLSTAYLVWGAVAMAWIEARARSALARDGVEDSRILVTPMPLTTFMARVVVMHLGTSGEVVAHSEAVHSLFADEPLDFRWRRFDANPALLPALSAVPAVARLQWFAHGFVSVRERDGLIEVVDLRMGTEPVYPFRFAVATRSAGTVRPLAEPELRGDSLGAEQVVWVWRRLWDADAPRPDGT